MYTHALKELRAGGPGLSLEGSLESELKRLTDAETMLAWNAKRGGALPMGSAEEVELEREFERVSKLRALCDKAYVLVRDRAAVHEQLRRQADARDLQDEEVASFMLAGEAAIVALKDKLQVMTDALEAGKKLNNGYDLLLEVLQAAAPSSEQHMSSVQQQLALSRQQLADLKQLRHKMYTDAEHLQMQAAKQIRDKLIYYQEARAGLHRKMRSLGVRAPGARRSRSPGSSGHRLVGGGGAGGKAPQSLTVSSDASLDGSALTGEPQPGEGAGIPPHSDPAAVMAGFVNTLEHLPESPYTSTDAPRPEVETLRQRYKREREERLQREKEANPVQSKFDTKHLAQSVLSLFKVKAGHAHVRGY